MVEGVSGVLAAHGKWERPQWEATRRRLVWRNGAIAQVFSAEDPESLRGPQFDAAWCDEIAKWRHAQEVWDMLQFGLRLGEWPRVMVTTTPRPLALLKKLMADPAHVVTRATTRANAANLPPDFLRAIEEKYGGTRLGRQEIEGAIVEERADALWSRDMIERARIDSAPPLARIVVAVDPPVASHKRADKCGIVAAGTDAEGRVYVIADATLAAARPAEWAARAVALYHELQADALVVEVNQGGDMVASVIAQVPRGRSRRRRRAGRRLPRLSAQAWARPREDAVAARSRRADRRPGLDRGRCAWPESEGPPQSRSGARPRNSFADARGPGRRLSIGFRALRATQDRKTGLRHLQKLDLWEISLVTFPMLPQARVTAVKSQPFAPAGADPRFAVRRGAFPRDGASDVR